MNYKVIIIKEPYHYYENSKKTRDLLSEVFRNQLKGYKQYYPHGVCPVGEYDFFTNHIIVIDKTFKRVLLSCKVIKYDTCKKFNKTFPLLSLLNSLSNPLYAQVTQKWLEQTPQAAYGHNWTIDPDLSKSVKKELSDITFAMYGSFFNSEKDIKSMIDISIMRFKIHKMKEWMGNSYFKDLNKFEVKEFGNLDGVLMHNDGLKWSQEYTNLIKKYEHLWMEREVISLDDFTQETWEEKRVA